MRNSYRIQIEQIIVHIINSRKPDGLILSERCIPLNQAVELTQKLTEYFAHHIQNALKDSATRAARFKTETFKDGGVVPQICHSVLHEGMDLVSGSKQVAKCLKDIIDRDQRIAFGNLVMCTYQAENYENEKFIALMKMDPSDVFRQKIEKDVQGQSYVSFDIEKNVMPTAQERLQKCAFVRFLEPRAEDYDMMLLDLQIQKQKEVAQFFTQDFLEVELTLDDLERTKQFYQGGVAAMNELRADLKPAENEAVSLAFDSAIRQHKVNIEQLITNLPLHNKHKQIIEQKLSHLIDREFCPDSSYVEKLPRKTRFTGDYGLVVSVNTEDYKDVIEKEESPTDYSPYWRITILTKKWKREAN